MIFHGSKERKMSKKAEYAEERRVSQFNPGKNHGTKAT